MRILTRQDFEGFITSRPVAVIHVDAAWDNYRQQVRASMTDAEARLKEFAAFAEVDCDTEGDLCRSMGVANIPCVAYFKEGKLVEMRVGVKQDIDDRTECLLG